MDVEIRVPQHPVELAAGAETTVAVELTNQSTSDIRVRLSVVHSRAGIWSGSEPRTVSLSAGGTQTVDVVVRPPADVTPATTLLPFTVQADDIDLGTPIGRATGLVMVTAPERLRATLWRTAAGRPAHFTLSLNNPGRDRLAVAITPRLHPPGGQVRVEPTAIDLPAGGTASAHVEVRPLALVVGGSIPYVVTLSCREAGAAEDAPALATVEETGQSPPRIGRAAVAGLTALLILIAAGALLLGGWEKLSGRDAGEPGDSADTRVRSPYAIVEVFQRDGEGPASADAALARLSAAGMPVRLVDSTLSPDVADGPDGLMVLLQDGFASAEEAQAYCDRHRAIAPRCRVVP